MIDVIIPSYNSKKYLLEAIESIKKQTISVNKIIIVDDGSTDGSNEFAKNIEDIFYLEQINSGAGIARNLGLKNSNADYIYFLDADDVAELSALETLYNGFKEDDSIKMVMGKRKEFISPDLSSEEKQRYRISLEAQYGTLPGCALIKKEAFNIVGIFDKNLKTGETVAWLAKYRDMGLKFINVDSIVLNRRIHLSNTGIIEREQEKQDYLKIIRQRLGNNKDVFKNKNDI